MSLKRVRRPLLKNSCRYNRKGSYRIGSRRVNGGRLKVMHMQVLFGSFILKAPSGGFGIWGIAPFILIFAIFYFLLILPQQRRQKQWKSMLGELKTGDRVTTSGGIKGT